MADFASDTMKDKKGYLSEEQLDNILEATTNIRDKVLLQIIYRCGRRVSEVLLLKEGDILWDDGKIIFNILKRKKPVRELKPVDTGTFKLLKEYLEKRDSMKFLRKKSVKGKIFPISRQYVYKMLRNAGKRAGITHVGDKLLHPHHLRHSFAVHQVKNNIKTADDLRKLQRYMGHANFNTTAHYLQYSSDELRDVTDMWDKKKKEIKK